VMLITGRCEWTSQVGVQRTDANLGHQRSVLVSGLRSQVSGCEWSKWLTREGHAVDSRTGVCAPHEYSGAKMWVKNETSRTQ
jgi:hypothetical protein